MPERQEHITWFVTKEDNRYGIQTMIPTLEMEVYNSNHSYHGWIHITTNGDSWHGT